MSVIARLNIALFFIIATSCWCSFAQEHASVNEASPTTNSGSIKSEVVCTDNSQREADLPLPGHACENREFAKRGKPVFFASQAGYIYGVSATPGNPTEVSIWLDNRTDEPQDYYVCCRASFLIRIDVYDAEGRLVPGGLDALFGCGCSGSVRVKPHTIKYVDGGNLKDNYVLTPGRYTITQKPLSAQIAAQRDLPKVNSDDKPGRIKSGPELSITIPQ